MLEDIATAIALALDGWALDGTGNKVRAYAQPQDSVTAPAATVSVAGVRWTDTGRSDGSALADVRVDVLLPASTAPVAALLAWRVLDQIRARLSASGGRTLGGTCLGWRMRDAQVTSTALGERRQGLASIGLDIWIGS